jgi:hypothetical protein
MVRERKAADESKGFDQDKGVALNEELEKADKDTTEVTYKTTEEIEVRGDAVPDKEG